MIHAFSECETLPERDVGGTPFPSVNLICERHDARVMEQHTGNTIHMTSQTRDGPDDPRSPRTPRVEDHRFTNLSYFICIFHTRARTHTPTSPIRTKRALPHATKCQSLAATVYASASRSASIRALRLRPSPLPRCRRPTAFIALTVAMQAFAGGLGMIVRVPAAS